MTNQHCYQVLELPGVCHDKPQHYKALPQTHVYYLKCSILSIHLQRVCYCATLAKVVSSIESGEYLSSVSNMLYNALYWNVKIPEVLKHPLV